MSDEILKPGTQKRVNVFASIPVSMPHGLGEIGFSRTAPISGRQMGVMLPIEVIRICILGRAQVDECLANGGLLRLTLANYNKNNNVTKDDKQQPVVVTPLQVKNGKIVPPPVRRPTKAVNIGGINAQPIIQSQEYHMPPANDPFSDVQENGSSSDSSAEAEVSEASTAETSTVVASEVQSVVNESAPAAEEEKKEEQAPAEEEAAAPIPNDPMLQMVAEAEAENKEEESEGEDEESDQAQSTEQNSQSKKKKKKH